MKHDLLSPECKYRSDSTDPFFKAATRDAIEQAKANALPNKPWAVFLKRRGMTGGYVLMDVADFGRIIRELQQQHDEHGYIDPDYKPEPYEWGANPLMDMILREQIASMRELFNQSPLLGILSSKEEQP